eukprot:158985-Rhodomonas_salina.3
MVIWQSCWWTTETARLERNWLRSSVVRCVTRASKSSDVVQENGRTPMSRPRTVCVVASDHAVLLCHSHLIRVRVQTLNRVGIRRHVARWTNRSVADQLAVVALCAAKLAGCITNEATLTVASEARVSRSGFYLEMASGCDMQSGT